MALTIPSPVLGSLYNHKEVEENFLSLAGRFGNIAGTDILRDASIPVSKLANTKDEVIVQLTVTAESLAAGWPVDDGAILAICPLPGEGGATDWTLTHISWVCTDVGTGGTAQARICTCSAVGSGFSYVSLLDNIPLSKHTNAGNDMASATYQTDVSVAVAVDTGLSLGLQSSGTLASALTAQGSFLTFTLRLARDMQV